MLDFRLTQRLAQFDERFAAENRADEEAIGRKRAADLDQRAGQIVHPVKRKNAGGEIETRRCKGQRLLIGGDPEAGRMFEHGGRQIGRDDSADLVRRNPGLRQRAEVAAEIESEREDAVDGGEAPGDFIGDAADQKIMRGKIPGRARAAAGMEDAIENLRGSGVCGP